jgi:hypothetical protein
LRAIEDHKYLRSCESCREVDLREAAEDFQARYERHWREAKQRADGVRQAQEIRKHLWIESEKAGRDVGSTTAGTEWILRYAHLWRRERESLRGNEFLEIEVEVVQGSGLAERGIRGLLDHVEPLSCDVFAGQEGMDRPDFCLRPEPDARELGFYLLRTCRLEALAALRTAPGECLLFATYGRDAHPALRAVEEAARAPVPVG